MPPKLKSWGDDVRAILDGLVRDGKVDIYNTELAHIDNVRVKHFTERTLKRFRNNYQKFAAEYNVETEFNGARRHNKGKFHFGKSRFLSCFHPGTDM